MGQFESNAIGISSNQGGKRGGDAQGGLAVSAGLGAGGGSGDGTSVLGSGIGVGVGVGIGVGGTADASAAGGDASDNSYIGSITINA